MNKFFVLVKKEIKELITIEMILPLIIMVVMFASIGNLLSSETKKMATPQALWIINEDGSSSANEAIEELKKAKYEIVLFNQKIEPVLKEAKQKNISGVLVFSPGFGQGIEKFEVQKIKLYSIVSNFSLISSIKSQGTMTAIGVVNRHFLDEWLKNKNINIKADDLIQPVGLEEYVVIGDKQAKIPLAQAMNFITKQTTLIPIILFMVIILAAQMVAMSVANEKENKTLETLLSSPVDRKTIVFAKLFSAGLVAILFSGVYMIGFNYYINGISGGALSSPAGQDIGQVMSDLGVSFGIGSYALLGISLFFGILVALAIAIILGILVESVKSVQAVTTPLMILVLLPYFLIMFLDINTVSSAIKYLLYAIPFSHPFLAAQKIITHDYLFIIYGIVYQAFIFLIFVIIAAKIFSSDKVFTLRLGKKKSEIKN